MEHRPFPPDATKPPQTRIPWPLIALIIAGALLIVTLWLTPRSNRAATRALNTSATGQLVLSHVDLAPQSANDQTNVDVYGEVTNTGTQPVTNAVVSATFHDGQGNSILVQQQPMERVDAESKDRAAAPKQLAEDPIEPGKTAGFRVSYTQIPVGWNHKPPDLSVLQVTQQK
jgi:hypothetical protein